MPRVDYKRCKECGKHASEVGTLSHTRLCRPCSKERSARNYEGLTTRSGPEFQRWRRQSVAAYGGVLLDDLRANP